VRHLLQWRLLFLSEAPGQRIQIPLAHFAADPRIAKFLASRGA
jgi:hypothetical protein